MSEVHSGVVGWLSLAAAPTFAIMARRASRPMQKKAINTDEFQPLRRFYT